jgi:hypothetical protein
VIAARLYNYVVSHSQIVISIQLKESQDNCFLNLLILYFLVFFFMYKFTYSFFLFLSFIFSFSVSISRFIFPIFILSIFAFMY